MLTNLSDGTETEPKDGNTSGTAPTARSVPNFDGSLKRLFAVVCGINDYESRDFSRLRGAVPDAADVVDLLLTNYLVPRDQILLLANKAASRSGIISALEGLSKDSRIRHGDPILFYFAGHGSEIPPPEGWECGGPGSQIQVIVPQDYCSKPGHVVPGIPDRSIGLLLDKIAHSKGDNITVILDCCHSASGTRGDSARSVELDPSIHTNDIDKNMQDGRVPRRGLASHVLLAACRPSEFARESGGRGAFTTELLHLLREFPPDQLRYRDILYKMRPIASQNPQCEGLHQDRYLFSSRVSTPDPISDTDLVINAEIAHDVTELAFCVKQERNPSGPPLGTCTVDKAMDFQSDMQPASNSTTSTSPLPSDLAVFQTNPGLGEPLRLYVPEPSDCCLTHRHRAKILRACGHDLHDVQFVDSRDEAHLELTVQGNQVVVTVMDRQATQQDFNRLHTTEIPWDKLGGYLTKARRFYRELNRSSGDADVTRNIDVEFYKLQERPWRFENASTLELSPSSANLVRDGKIHLVVEEGCSYGAKIINNGPYDLHPSLLYFDSSDPSHTIRTYYQPPSSGRYSLEPPLKRNGGSLTIGYGSGGMPPFSYSLSESPNIGFLKLFVSTHPLNSSSATGALICSSGAHCGGPAPRDTWGAITIPMIQRPPVFLYGCKARISFLLAVALKLLNALLRIRHKLRKNSYRTATA